MYLKLGKCPCNIPQSTRIPIHFNFLQNNLGPVRLVLWGTITTIETGSEKTEEVDCTLKERSSSRDSTSSSNGMKQRGYSPMVRFVITPSSSSTQFRQSDRSSSTSALSHLGLKHGLHNLKNNFGLIRDQYATKQLPIMIILTGTR